MIDEFFHVRRYIAEHYEKTDALVAEFDLASFDLIKLQIKFIHR
ncbi:MAG: hypothetical protein ACI8VC_000472 [Candidatus Endobugula sp.]|jgi:hypothetical protein